MAVSTVDCFGLLNRWREFVNEDIWTFNQVDNGLQNKYPPVYVQSERDILAQSLRDAFLAVGAVIGHFPRPVYEKERLLLNSNRTWNNQTLRLSKSGHLQEFGRRKATLVSGTYTVSYSGDTATVTFNSAAVSNLSQLQIYFQTADGAPSGGDARYRIEPVVITEAGASSTLKGHRSLFIKPSFWDTPIAGDPDNPANRAMATKSDASFYVTAVDLYVVTTDSANAVLLLFHPEDDETSVTSQAVNGIVTDGPLGEFVCRSATQPGARPFAVEAEYLAGLPENENGDIATDLETSVIRIAHTFTPEMQGEPAYRQLDMWRRDNEDATQAFPNQNITHLANPYGFRRGQIESWFRHWRYVDKLRGKGRTWLQS